MKYIFLTLLLFAAGCSTEKKQPENNLNSKAVADSVKIIDTKTISGDAQFFYPKFSHDGSKIFFTSANFKGIWFYSINNGEIKKITSDEGAGYEFVESPDGDKLIYISKSYIKNPRGSFEIKSADINKAKSEKIYTAKGNISNLKLLDDGSSIVFMEGDSLKEFSLKENSLEKNANINDSIYKIDQNKLIRITDGKTETVFEADDNLVWLDQNENGALLIYETGKGAYLINKNKRFLGDLRNARLSPDGDKIIFMLDEDDGHVITASDIYFTTVQNPNAAINLTDSRDVFEMNPCWSPDGKEIAYNTYDGKIILAKLQFVN